MAAARRRIKGILPKASRLGIEIAPDSIRIALVGWVRNTPTLLRSATAPRGFGDDDAIARNIRQAISTAGIGARNVSIVWSDEETFGPVHQTTLDLPPMRPSERAEIALRQISRVLNAAMKGAKVDTAVLKPGGPEALSRVWAVAAPTAGILRACRLIESARLISRAVVITPDSLRGLRSMASQLPSKGVFALAHVDRKRGAIALFDGDELLQWRVFGDFSIPRVATGNEELDDSQSLGVEVVGEAVEGDDEEVLDLSEAEVVEELPAWSEDVAMEGSQRLAEDIERSLNFFRQQNRDAVIDNLWVSGPEKLAQEICSVIRRKEQYQVEPLSRAGLTTGLGPYGLAAGAAAVAKLPGAVNLAPLHYRQRPEVKFILAGGAILALLALLAGSTLRARFEAQRLNARADLESAMLELEALADVKETQNRFNRITSAGLLWNNVLGRTQRYHDRWIELMMGLSAVPPASGVFHKLSFDAQGESMNGSLTVQVKGKDLKEVESVVSTMKNRFDRLPFVQSLEFLPAEAKREASGSYNIQIDVRFAFAVATPIPPKVSTGSDMLQRGVNPVPPARPSPVQ